MRLLTQPSDGAAALIKEINAAKSSVEIAIFRFDHREIEKSLIHAVSRGVSVRALIAHTNRAGEENLRKLETRLLGNGVTVTRSADDLLRYHGKFIILDRRELYVLGFNLTYQDIEHCRSFGVITQSRRLVLEAARLFEADCKRTPFEPALDTFVVSPSNARRQLSAFIQGAKSQLLIYDPKVSDPEMIRLLEKRAKAGVDLRIIGKVTRKSAVLAARKMAHLRLHTRTMIRDGQLAFVGSQSLRAMELDMRREIGIIFRDANLVKQLSDTFGDDWLAIEQDRETVASQPASAEELAKRVAKAVTNDLPAVAPVVDNLVKELAENNGHLKLNSEDVGETVNQAVRQAVKEAVQEAVEEVVQQAGGERK